MEYFELEGQRVDIENLRFSGRVLDIGGGGEGVVSRHAGPGVVAIDRRLDELREAPGEALKIVMDACDMQFIEDSFDHITCFYTLMYMTREEIEGTLREAYRVMKRGGTLWIWDTTIPPQALGKVFIVQLEAHIHKGEIITAGYGTYGARTQTMNEIADLCEGSGFCCQKKHEEGGAFFLRLTQNA